MHPLALVFLSFVDHLAGSPTLTGRVLILTPLVEQCGDIGRLCHLATQFVIVDVGGTPSEVFGCSK